MTSTTTTPMRSQRTDEALIRKSARRSAPVDRLHPALKILKRVLIGIFCILSLLPVYAALVTSLTEYRNVGDGDLWPKDWAFENYVEVWSQIPLVTYMLATTVYALVAAVGCVVTGILAAFALSRMSFRGKQFLLYSLLVSQVIPLIVIAVPLFTLIRSIGLFDTYSGITLVVAGTHLAFPIMFLKSYFDGIPREIEEAAQVDGCSQFQALVRIVLPTAIPAIATTFALVFFTSWQIFIVPLLLSISDEKATVTVGIFRMLSDSYTPWHYVMAASIIASIPPIVVFLLAQRQLIGGLTAGAVK